MSVDCHTAVRFGRLEMVAKRVCTTPACLKAATQIVTYVDQDVDPCDDFFKFACGRYIRESFNGIQSSPLRLLQKRLENELDEITKQPINENDHHLVKLQKELINGCLNESGTPEESLDTFKRMLAELHGWPVVVGHGWREHLFDWKNVVLRLRQKGYFYSMMLEIGVAVDPNDMKEFIVRIDLPNTVLNDNYDRRNYISYMTGVVRMLGAEEQLAEAEMEKVFDFIERLKKIINGNTIKTEEINETETVITTVREFQNQYHEWDWFDFINNILFPAANITYKDKIMFPTKECMKELLNLISKTPKRTQANYIFWKVYQHLHPLITKQLRQAYNNYTFLTYGETCPKERFKLCKEKINELFLPEPTDILYIRKHLPQRKRQKIQELLKMIKSEFKKLLQKTSWMDADTKQKAIEKANAINEIIGTIGNYFNDSILEHYEFIKKKVYQKETFLKMYLNRFKDQIDASYSLIHKPVTNGVSGILHHFLPKSVAFYVANHNTILLPAGILQGIFYDEERPMYLNFGAIGSIIGHELTHGFCKRASNFNKDGQTEKMWTQETERAYEEKTKCIIKNAEDFLLKNTTNRINGFETIEENIADYTGLRVAYSAYEEWVGKNGKEEYLSGLDYTPKQLFWISAVTYNCYELNEKMTRIMLERDNHAINTFRAIEPLRNNEDFAKDFNCLVGSRMNPSINSLCRNSIQRNIAATTCRPPPQKMDYSNHPPTPTTPNGYISCLRTECFVNYVKGMSLRENFLCTLRELYDRREHPKRTARCYKTEALSHVLL
ncbi:hypothetical protein ILUMI_21610 [Ignelater luminosus]|uniref:Uncharacterized protein n=1 Tax=Ignelater luminosus TaxID=2038154 RepID=A0A8K0CFC1_IGNLU|nr:hypothetical protein ILUMI_21610 [Ignelater luminosus]